VKPSQVNVYKNKWQNTWKKVQNIFFYPQFSNLNFNLLRKQVGFFQYKPQSFWAVLHTTISK
jgi:hypothetical protein